MELAGKTCAPCHGGVPPLSREAAERYLAQAEGWSLDAEAMRIERSFRLPNFRAALEFAGKVGEIAEAEAHHPDIRLGWG
jgi:4a-hydroxytetrahydrobiopterin dehydratase